MIHAVAFGAFSDVISDEYRARQIQLRLAAAGRSGLYRRLTGACGSVLGEQFRLDRLFAVGRQSFIFLGTDLKTNAVVVVKQPAFNYDRPLTLSRTDIKSARESLAREVEILAAAPINNLPTPIAILTDEPAVVPGVADHPELSREHFLVMEYIDAPTLTFAALQIWVKLSPQSRERIVRSMADRFIRFWTALLNGGWFYGDISAENFLIPDSGLARVVDAGSVVPAGGPVMMAGFTPAYTTPRIFENATHGRPLPADLSSILPSFAKVIHFALTRREPFNGTLPDTTIPELACHGPVCVKAIDAMLGLDAVPQGLTNAMRYVDEWLRE